MFLNHAFTHASTSSSFDRMLAIHNLDNSIEYILKIIVRHLELDEEIGNLDNCELAQLAGGINKFFVENCSMALPYLSEIKLLRKIRNLVQHAMIDPEADLHKFLTIAQRFFEKVLTKIFDLTIEEVSISGVIHNQELKDFLKQAEILIENKRYLEAVVASRDAFENARFLKLRDSSLNINLIPALLETKDSFNYLYSYLRNLHEELELEKLGVESRLYKKYLAYINHIPHQYCADWHSNIVMQRDWNKDDAMFCYSFVSDLIYKWEQSEVGPLYSVDPPLVFQQPSWIERIGLIKLERVCDGGCEYIMSGNDRIKYFFSDRETKTKLLENIATGEIYEYITETYVNEGIVSKSYEFIEIIAIDFRLITNNQERWEVMVWMRKIPLTYYQEIFMENEFQLNPNHVDISNTTREGLLVNGVPESVLQTIFYPKDYAKGTPKILHAQQIYNSMLSSGVTNGKSYFYLELVNELRSKQKK